MSETTEFIRLSKEYRDKAEALIEEVQGIGRSLVLIATDDEADEASTLLYGSTSDIIASLVSASERLSIYDRIHLAQIILDKAKEAILQVASPNTNQTAN